MKEHKILYKMIGEHLHVRPKSQRNMLEEQRLIQFLEEDDIEENKTNEHIKKHLIFPNLLLII